MKIKDLDDKYLIEMSVPETADIEVDVIEKDNVIVVNSIDKKKCQIELSKIDAFRKVIGLPRNANKGKIKSSQTKGKLEITIPKIKEKVK